MAVDAAMGYILKLSPFQSWFYLETSEIKLTPILSVYKVDKYISFNLMIRSHELKNSRKKIFKATTWGLRIKISHIVVVALKCKMQFLNAAFSRRYHQLLLLIPETSQPQST